MGNPFDVLKTRMMTSEGAKPPTLGEAAGALPTSTCAKDPWLLLRLSLATGLPPFLVACPLRMPLFHTLPPLAHVSLPRLSLSGTLFKAQGIAGFYRGIEANVMRAMVLNGTKMACYDQIKGAHV